MISDDYKKQIEKLHSKKNWGTTSTLGKKCQEVIEKYNPKSILDFGCGNGQITDLLKQTYPEKTIYGYDPAFHDSMPDNVDMIMSTDVLEHIEPNYLKNTLADLDKRCNIVQYHLIACFKSKKALPDGRNAHLIVETPDWWQEHMYNKSLYNVIHEDVFANMAPLKKGPPKAVVKYECVLLKK